MCGLAPVLSKIYGVHLCYLVLRFEYPYLPMNFWRLLNFWLSCPGLLVVFVGKYVWLVLRLQSIGVGMLLITYLWSSSTYAKVYSIFSVLWGLLRWGFKIIIFCSEVFNSWTLIFFLVLILYDIYYGVDFTSLGG